MYYYFITLILIVGAASVRGHNCTSKSANVRPLPQNYSSFHEHDRFNEDKWMNIRVFADTSFLLTDTEACDRVGKWIRVGVPEGDAVGHPKCSSFLENDCWQLCTEKDVLTEVKAEAIREILVPVVNYLQSLIKVKRVEGNIRIPREAVPVGCADHIVLPDYYSNTGISSTDLVLVVTGRPTTAYTVAWATECAADQSGRPVFGHINIGPGELDNFETQKHYIYKVLLHELIHVLGFNSYKFPFYKDIHGNPYPSVTKTHIVNGKKVNKVVTPRVVAAARDHFGCHEMDGVPLEDGGDETTVDSHWEKRIFRNELMTGSSDHTAVISKITLALLEDMGWYRVDYTQAEHLEWGYGMGCNFVNSKCSDVDKKGYFCSDAGAKGCTSDRTAMGYCNLVRHKNELPKEQRYFSDPYMGGDDELSDYCPYVAAYSNGVCADGDNQPETALFGEQFGDNSMCFESSLVQDGFKEKKVLLPMCYKFRCVDTEDTPTLEVGVAGLWHECPFGKTLENVNGFTGQLSCPNISFCSGPSAVSRQNSARFLNAHASSGTSVFRSSSLLFLFMVLVCVYL